MMHFIRNVAQNWILKLFLFLIAVTFISFYGLSEYRGCNPNHAAVVNGEPISVNALRREYNALLDQWTKSGLLKKGSINAQMRRVIMRMALERLINTKLLLQEAKRNGIVVSDEEVAQFVKRQFGLPEDKPMIKETFERYRRFIQYQGMTMREFEENIRNMLIQKRFAEIFKSTVYVPEEEVKKMYKDKNEKLNLYFVRVKPDPKKSASYKPSQEEIKKYYNEHKADLNTPEKRVFTIITFRVPETINPDTAKDEKTRQELFKKRKEFLDKAKAHAKKISEKVMKGEKLEKAAQEKWDGPAPVIRTLGPVPSTGPIEDKDAYQILSAAFRTAISSVSEPIEGWSGAVHLVRVDKIIPPRPMTLKEAQEKIEKELRKKMEENAAKKEAEKVLRKLKQAENPHAMARALGLEVEETGLFSMEDVRTKGSVPKIGGNSKDIATAAFNMTKENNFSAEPFKLRKIFIIWWVKERKPADMKKFEEIKLSLMKAAREERAGKLLNEWVSHERKRMEKKIMVYYKNLKFAFPAIYGMEE